eukprot:GHRR01004049.1.p1 GENE.GHRR01004049.1~~GHRR01004049.1.p1  ORF type:complete len:236 (+),score=92.73 GHRR01004049.1:805-1512(+)
MVGCHAVLNQDVLPKGCPSFLAHMPVLGGMLRRISLSTISRLVEDILNIVNKYTAAKGKLSLDEVMAKIAAERGHKTTPDENRLERLSDVEHEAAAASSGEQNGKVASFAVDQFSDSESEAGGNAEHDGANYAQQHLQQQKSSTAAVSEGASSNASSSEHKPQRSPRSARVSASSADGVVGILVSQNGVAANKAAGDLEGLSPPKHSAEHAGSIQVALDASAHGDVAVRLTPAAV